MYRLFALAVALVLVAWIVARASSERVMTDDVVTRRPGVISTEIAESDAEPIVPVGAAVTRSGASSPEAADSTALDLDRSDPAGPVFPARCGAALITLMTSDGGPAGEGWVGAAVTVRPLMTGVPRDHIVFSAIDPVTGFCVIEGVEPGDVRLRAVHSSFPTIESEFLTLEPGGSLDAVLIIPGARYGNRIRIRYEMPSLDWMLQRVLRNAPVAAELLAGERVVGTLDGAGIDAPGDGPYTVRVVDPRFLSASIDDVRPGQQRSIELVSSAAMLLDVRGASGLPHDAYDLDVTPVGLLSASALGGRLRSAATPLPENGRYALPTGVAFAFVVDAGAYGRAHGKVGPLEPGEECSLGVTLPGDQRIVRVQVTRGRWRVPAPDVQVALVTAPVNDDNPDVRAIWGQIATGHSRPGSMVADNATTDALGHAVLGAPRDTNTEQWSVCTIDRGQRRTVAAVAETVHLHLPGMGRIAVEFAGVPVGVSFPPAGVRLTSRATNGGPQSMLAMRNGVPFVRAGLGFVAEDVVAGEHAVVLNFPYSRERPNEALAWNQPYDLPLATVHVKEGETSHVRIDASPFLLGTLQVEVQVNGAPLVGARVVATVVKGTGVFATTSSPRSALWQGIGARTDRDGVAVFPQLPPAGWRLSVMAKEEKWIWGQGDAGHRVTIRPGDREVTRLRIATHTARIAIAAAPNGDLLRRWSLLFVAAEAARSGGFSAWVLKTDAAGELDLTLPLGEYILSRTFSHAMARGDGAVLKFAWPLESDAESVLRLPALLDAAHGRALPGR